MLCDAANGGAHCLDCEIELCLCKEGVARILKDWEWTIRYEAEVARDVQWKAQRGGCMNFEEATPECPVCGNRKDSSYIKCPICKGVGMLLTPEAEIEMDYYLDRSPGWTGKQTADKKMYRHIRLLQEFFALESAEYVSWRTPIEEPSDSLPSEGNLESWIVEHSRVLLESEAPEAVWMLIAHSNNPTCVTQPAMM